MPCVGGYIDGPFHKLGDGNKNILTGKAQEYGHRRIATIQRSDNRNADHDLLGNHRTWIKWAIPTAEALRQACLARESTPHLSRRARAAQRARQVAECYEQQLPRPNRSRMQSPVQRTHWRSRDRQVVNPQYLRWGLCDQPSGEIEDGELPNYQRRRSRLIEHTLKPVQGKVEVRFSVDDSPHVVRRDSRSNILEIKIGAAPFEACSEEQVRSLLPVQAYSQKQLSDVSVRLEELLRFITTTDKKPVRDDCCAPDTAGGIVEKYAARERRRMLEATVTQRELTRQSLEQQAAEIRKRLTGLRDEDKALIDAAPHYQEAGRVVSSWTMGLQTTKSDLEQGRRKIEATRNAAPPVQPKPESELLSTIRAAYIQALDNAISSIATAEAEIARSIAEQDGQFGAWKTWHYKLDVFEEQYATAAERSSAHATRLKELAEIEKQLGELRAGTEQIRAEIVVLGEADADCDAARE